MLDCFMRDKPQPLYPLEQRTEQTIKQDSELEFPCVGLVGPRHASCDGEQGCDIGWQRTVDQRAVPVSDNLTERVHFVNEWM